MSAWGTWSAEPLVLNWSLSYFPFFGFCVGFIEGFTSCRRVWMPFLRWWADGELTGGGWGPVLSSSRRRGLPGMAVVALDTMAASCLAVFVVACPSAPRDTRRNSRSHHLVPPGSSEVPTTERRAAAFYRPLCPPKTRFWVWSLERGCRTPWRARLSTSCGGATAGRACGATCRRLLCSRPTCRHRRPALWAGAPLWRAARNLQQSENIPFQTPQ